MGELRSTLPVAKDGTLPENDFHKVLTEADAQFKTLMEGLYNAEALQATRKLVEKLQQDLQSQKPTEPDEQAQQAYLLQLLIKLYAKLPGQEKGTTSYLIPEAAISPFRTIANFPGRVVIREGQLVLKQQQDDQQ